MNEQKAVSNHTNVDRTWKQNGPATYIEVFRLFPFHAKGKIKAGMRNSRSMEAKMVRIICFLLVAWLLASCAPVYEVAQQNAALDRLRPVVRAMLSSERDSRLELVQFLKTTCTNQDGLGGPPKCPEEKPEGSEVEVFPLGGAEGTFVTREAIGPVLEIQVQALYAIYQIPVIPEAEPNWPEGEYGLIFKREVNGYTMPVTVRVSDGKIVRIDHAL